MTPHDLADRIESLDWSRTSLQHQLVMSAAVLALRGGSSEEVENPVGEMRSLLEDLLQHRATRPGGCFLLDTDNFENNG